MAEFDGGGKGGPGKKSKGSSLWDGLKQFGQGVMAGFAGGVSPGGAAGARRDPVTSNERPAAAQQIHRSLKAWRDRENEAGGARVQRKPQIPTGGGAPLPGGVKSKMEGKLGANLSDVKIHTDGDSSKASEDLNAKAFTVGNDVHFGSGEFDPSSKEGEKLIAHELTHVVQGQKGGVQRKEESDDGDVEGADGEAMEVSDPDEPAEKEADAVSEKVVEGDGEEEAGADEKPAAVASRKAFRAPRVGHVPGLYNSASNVNKPLGSLKEPQGTLVYLDNPMNPGPDGKPTSVRTEVEWTAKDGTKAVGSVKRSLKVNPDGTKTLIADAAFLDKIPREGNFVSSDGIVMLPGKGTPLHVYLSLRQMRMMGINEGDLGKTVTQVKISTIVNERAIDDLGAAVGWQKVAPNSDQLRGCHSGMYVENYVTQNGGVVLSARLESEGFAQLSADKKKAKGLPPTQDAWVLKPFFSIILECGVARPGMLPAEKKAP